MKAAIVLWGQPSKAAVSALRCPVMSFEDVMAKGAGRDFQAVPVQGSDLATLCYTSGTSGNAKVRLACRPSATRLNACSSA